MTYLSALLRLSIARPLLLASALLFSAVAQAAPTGLLNDTGQTQCADANDALVTCDSTTTGNAGTRPRQDGRFGRDVASPTKVGGGAAGFDFTPLDASGNAIALTSDATPVPVATPICVKDNVTNLIWEVKAVSGLQATSHTYAWGNNAGAATCGASVTPCNTDAYIAALNAANVCGETANDWRLPTRRELLSIGHLGLTDSTAKIDVNYFPATQMDYYWTAATYAPSTGSAWFVNFSNGYTGRRDKTSSSYVRLVRSGQ